MTVRLVCLLTFICLMPLARAGNYAWEPIGWREGEIVRGEGKVRFAITLSVRINGNACTAQLDTGANRSVNWHVDGDPSGERSPMVIEALGKTMQVSGAATFLARIGGGKCNASVIASPGERFF